MFENKHAQFKNNLSVSISVLINCYNYESFVADAIRSVGAQTQRPDELIVVDDGSTDDSAKEIENALREVGFGRLLKKKNGGQLSAFERGIVESKGEWIFFLDADDLYKPDHIATIVEKSKEHPGIDFFFTDVEEFGDTNGRAFHYRGPEGDLGYSALQVLGGFRITNVFVGGVTSTLCVRRKVLERFMPFSAGLLSDWRIRADNVLVYGTSVAGARKFNVARQTVRYRVHGDNAFAGSKRDKAVNSYNVLITERLMGFLHQMIPYTQNSLSGLGVEYRGVPKKNSHLKKCYWKIALRGNIPFFVRLRILFIMLKSDLF